MAPVSGSQRRSPRDGVRLVVCIASMPVQFSGSERRSPRDGGRLAVVCFGVSPPFSRIAASRTHESGQAPCSIAWLPDRWIEICWRTPYNANKPTPVPFERWWGSVRSGPDKKPLSGSRHVWLSDRSLLSGASLFDGQKKNSQAAHSFLRSAAWLGKKPVSSEQ